jgi:hypothetical protein
VGAGVADAVGVGVADAVGVATALDVAGVEVEHADRVIVFVSRVTAPFRARTRPSTVAPVVSVMLVRAMTVPRKAEPVPRVAELPTCQNTLHAWAPLIRATWLPDAVVRLDPAWNTNTEFGLPAASNVSVPVSPSEEAEL